MERYAYAEEFLNKYMRGRAEPVTKSDVERVMNSRLSLMSLRIQKDCLLSIADQYFHGSDLLDREVVWQRSMELSRYPIQLSPSFPREVLESHLVYYAGSFYSYLFAEMVADGFWDTSIEGRSHGQKLRSDLLEKGFGKDPRKGLERMLGGGWLDSVVH